MDFGVGDLPPGQVRDNNVNNTVGSMDNRGPYAESVASMKGLDLQPPQGALPYLVPKANVSRESLHSLSDPRDNPYGAIYTSTPPSPGGALSPFADQNSIGGRNTRNHIPPISQLDDHNPNMASKLSSRVPSPLAFSEIPQQSEDTSPSKLLAEHNRNVSPSESPLRSPFRDRRPLHDEDDDFESRSLSPNPVSPDFTKYEQTDVTQQLDHAVFELGIPSPLTPTTIPRSAPNTDIYQPSEEFVESDPKQSSQYFEEQSMTMTSGIRSAGQDIHSFDSREETYHNRQATQFNDHIHQAAVEEEDDHATRIQSVYNQYYNDSQYYDGSEEWESLPQHLNHENHYQSRPPMPSNSDRAEWRDSAEQFYDDQAWQHENNREYYHDDTYGQGRAHESPGRGFNPQWNSPPVQPSYYSRPSTSYSTSSLPSRARTPARPLEPLTDLPSARYKLDDLASPISFSKPRRFIGASGQASPINRPASPAQVLSSSWSQLSELPTPHRLRRSGSFSSINFSPARKYAPSEIDAGDTASIRSLARTEASLMAVSAGAGRINRLPQDLVPVGKSGLMESLRPQNYDGNRYI